MKVCCAGLLLMSVLASQPVRAQTPSTAPVAATPPMGWNSWDSYGLTITEKQFRDNAQVVATKLKPFGWNYAVIDEGWFFFNPEARDKPDTLVYAIDGYGRYVPVPARFPSAKLDFYEGALPHPPVGLATPAKFAAPIQSTSFKPLAD